MNKRISKYNPKYRDSNGAYTKNEWTSISDIGKNFDGKIFTRDEYIEIEDKYLDAIEIFINYHNIKKIRLVNLENYNDFNLKGIELKDYNVYPNKEALIIAKYILREDFWGELKGENGIEICFGYDYLMSFKSNTSFKEVIRTIENLGLYVE